MARKVVKKEVVFAAADALAAQGVDATTVLVQAKTGGSYTTIKRFLEQWADERSAASSAVDVPAEIETRGKSLIGELYALCLRSAQEAVAEPVERAVQARMKAEERLAGAEAEVTRLEAVEQGLFERNESLSARVHELELDAATMGATMAERSALAIKLEALLSDSRALVAERDREIAELRASAKAVEGLQALLEDLKERGRRVPNRKGAGA